MSYKRVPPADDSEMKRIRYLQHHTICEKLREIWRETEDPNIKMKAKEAMAMAKRMNEMLKKFREYRESGENQEDD